MRLHATLYIVSNLCQPLKHDTFLEIITLRPEAEFKEFEPRHKFETRLKYGWFYFKLYSMFQELSRGYPQRMLF